MFKIKSDLLPPIVSEYHFIRTISQILEYTILEAFSRHISHFTSEFKELSLRSLLQERNQKVAT